MAKPLVLGAITVAARPAGGTAGQRRFALPACAQGRDQPEAAKAAMENAGALVEKQEPPEPT